MYLIVDSWLSYQDQVKIGDLEDNGYKVIQAPRQSRKGGGIICVYKMELNIEKIKPPFVIKTMEFMEVMLTLRGKKTRLVIIYRPKPSKKNIYTLTAFFTEFRKLLAYYNLLKDEVVIMGDFNFHVNKVADPDTRKLNEILTSFSLTQHINEPTHKDGNTLRSHYYQTIVTVSQP